MWKATLRGILARKVRLALTALAVILGVAFVSGTFVLTDTLKSAYNQVYAQFGKGSEIIVSSKQDVLNVLGFGRGSTGMDASVLGTVRATSGVGAAAGLVQSDAVTLLDRTGAPARTGFSRTLGISWPNADAGPFVLRSGRAPMGPDEIVMDARAADQYGYAIGDVAQVSVSGKARQPYRVVGLIGLGSATDLGGASYVGWTLPTAQELFGKIGKLDLVFVRTAPGASVNGVVRDLNARIGPDNTAVNSVAFAQAQAADSNGFLSFFNGLILAFAALGIFVGAFIIANTFIILVQQRTRELGLLRALGASGAQVRRSVIAEAVAVGLFASLVGFVVGMLLGRAFLALLPRIGFPIPAVDAVIEPRTFAWALVIGLGVTIGSAVWPAQKAATISPIAAITDPRPRPSKPFLRPRPVDPPPVRPVVRQARIGLGVLALVLAALCASVVVTSAFGSMLQRGALAWIACWLVVLGLSGCSAAIARFLLSRLVLAIEFVALGVAFVLAAFAYDGANTTGALQIAGIGLLTLFLGVVIGTALVARPVARVLGTRPIGVLAVVLGALIIGAGIVTFGQVAGSTSRSIFTVVGAVLVSIAGLALLLAGPALFGAIGLLARGNAMRNPRRTATTASAIVIGMSLIAVVAVFAESLKTETRNAIKTGVRADYVVNGQQYAGFSSELVTKARALPSAQAAVALRFVDAKIADRDDAVAGVTLPGLDDVLNLNVTRGSVAGLAAGGILVTESFAKDAKVGMGDRVLLELGPRVQFEAPIVGLYRNSQFTGQRPASVIADTGVLDRAAGRSLSDNQLFVLAKTGQVDLLGRELRALTSEYPTVGVRTFQQFEDDAAGFIGTLVNILFGLLMFSLVIALLGIVNTLLLSVYERTRELGLLRAIGATRPQIRRMIRGEGVIIAVLGAVLGLGLGLLWAWVLLRVVGSSGFATFSVPWTQLGSFAVLSAAAAVLAAVIPAWRAGRLNVLTAIAEG